MDHLYVGLDIAKDHIDVGVLPSGQAWQVPQSPDGLQTLVDQLTELGPAVIVLEASGGYERPALVTLTGAGLPVARIDPRQVREFARASGQRAKTDRLDALLLAQFAARMEVVVRPLPDGETEQIQTLARRRQQVLEMIAAEKNRLQQAQPVVQEHIRAHIAWLEGQKRELDRELRQLVDKSPVYRAKDSLLQSIKGIGEVSAVSLLAAMPELGTLSRRQTASLAGLAPVAHDSGAFHGKRYIQGGRATARQALYMATLVATRYNPDLRTFYQRLIAKGKPPKVAITACMRKLLLICNAVLRDHVPWQPVHTA